MKYYLFYNLFFALIFLTDCSEGKVSQTEKSSKDSILDTIGLVVDDRLNLQNDSENNSFHFLHGSWLEFGRVGGIMARPIKTSSEFGMSLIFRNDSILEVYYGEELFSSNSILVGPGQIPFDSASFTIRYLKLKNHTNDQAVEILINKTQDTLTFKYHSEESVFFAKE